MKNSMSIRFDALPTNEGFARSVVAAFCVPYNPTLDIINDIKTSVSEAVTNCIVHAYKDREGEIMIEAEITNKTLIVKVSDYGRGIVDVENAITDFFTTEPEAEHSGLGFTIMKSFMDNLYVESVDGSGTTVTLTKKLG